jgi:hypothetical protein
MTGDAVTLWRIHPLSTHFRVIHRRLGPSHLSLTAREEIFVCTEVDPCILSQLLHLVPTHR